MILDANSRSDTKVYYSEHARPDMRAPYIKSLVIATLSLSVLTASAVESQLWKEFISGKENPTLPDFSFAGYRNGAEGIKIPVSDVFNVTDYGASPDDGLDDREGIQKAIDAAAANGGGIVFFPRGRYLVNSQRDLIGTIKIPASNIVLKGEGSGDDGTIIHQIYPFRNGHMHDHSRMHLKQSIIRFAPAREEDIGRPAKVVEGAKRGAFTLTVEDTAELKPGDAIRLHAKNQAIFEAEINPLEVQKEWTTIVDNSARASEFHHIANIEGNRITFSEPLLRDIRGRDGWQLQKASMIEQVGVEDIAFEGNAYTHYAHHRSDRDDIGWAFVRMSRVRDGWIRRCRFTNASTVSAIRDSDRISMLNLVIDGSPGHHTPRVMTYSTNVLGAFIRDLAGFTHGPSISWGTAGSVFWECSSAGAFDSHGGFPTTSLFDSFDGGEIRSAGGRRDRPHHLRDMVVWNFRNTAPTVVEYDFWKNRNFFVKPVIAGFHGNPANFNEETVGVMESYGEAVEPRSLYAAQLEHRLGKLPEWVAEARATEKEMLGQKRVQVFSYNAPEQQGYMHRVPFGVEALATELCELSLETYNSVPFELQIAPESKEAVLENDEVMLSHMLYMLMNAVYNGNSIKNGNRLEVLTVDEGKKVRFRIVSGPATKAVSAEARGFLAQARRFAPLLGADIQVHSANGLVFEVDLPVAR